MDKNNQLENTNIATQEKTYEVVVEDLNLLLAKWSDEKLRTESVINVLTYIALDQTFAQVSDPSDAVRLILDQLGRAVEVNTDDEEFKGMFQRLYLHDGEIH